MPGEECFEFLAHSLRGLEALGRSLGEQLQHDPFEFHGQVRHEARRPWWLLFNLREDDLHLLSNEGTSPREQLEGDDSDGVEIRGGLYPFPSDLLWSHVLRCSQDMT